VRGKQGMRAESTSAEGIRGRELSWTVHREGIRGRELSWTVHKEGIRGRELSWTVHREGIRGHRWAAWDWECICGAKHKGSWARQDQLRLSCEPCWTANAAALTLTQPQAAPSHSPHDGKEGEAQMPAERFKAAGTQHSRRLKGTVAAQADRTLDRRASLLCSARHWHPCERPAAASPRTSNF